jgi:hypothetical protein
MRHSILFQRARELPPFGGVAALADRPETRVCRLPSLSVAQGTDMFNGELVLVGDEGLGHERRLPRRVEQARDLSDRPSG